jgi:hypothetical protein
MKKLLLTLIVSLAFCGSIFAQHPETHWPGFSNGPYEDQGALYASIMVNGEPVTIETPNWEVMEIAAFVGEEMRMVGMFLTDQYVLEWDELFPTTNAEPIYYTTPGDTVTFKMFNHATGVEYGICEPIIWDGDGEIVTILTGEEHWEGFDDPDHPLMLNFIGEEPQPTAYTKDIPGYNGAAGGYYLITSPVVDETTPSAVNGFITDAYDLYYFDQSEELEWRNYKAGAFTVANGVGYLYASNSDTQLSFTGTPYSGDGTIELAYDDNAEIKGANLVGNPFLVAAAPDRDYYVMNDERTDVMTEPSTELVPPMEGCFVFAENEDETVTFSTEAKGENSLIALNISSAGKVVDRAIVRFGQGRMLPKFQLNPNSTKIYVTLDGNDYAVVRSEDMGELPLSFKAERNGDYNMTLSTENVDFAYLHLIDNLTGADQDLLANPSYAFNASTTDYANRFRLVFATGNNDDTFAFFSNGSLFVNNEGIATLQVVDVTGRIIKSESINGCANVNIDAAPGVYMVRLVNGDNIKVQKVVK